MSGVTSKKRARIPEGGRREAGRCLPHLEIPSHVHEWFGSLASAKSLNLKEKQMNRMNKRLGNVASRFSTVVRQSQGQRRFLTSEWSVG